MKVMYIKENDKFYCEETSTEYGYHSKKEISETKYRQATESLYYYQLIDDKYDPLNGLYCCCGMVHERQEQKEFYIKHFLNHDSRYGSKEVDHISKLVIVRGYRGNVADRDGLPILTSDIIEEYTK